MRRVEPSLLRMMGPYSSKRIVSPNRMDRRFESGSGGGSRGRSLAAASPGGGDGWFENASAVSVVSMVSASTAVIKIRGALGLWTRNRRIVAAVGSGLVYRSGWVETVETIGSDRINL